MLEKRLEAENRMQGVEAWRMRTKPTVLDLLSGCGGLSLGFQRTGFSIFMGVEMEPKPAETDALDSLKGAER